MKLYYLWYFFILDLFWSLFWSKILFFMVILFPLLIGPSRRRPGSAGEAASDVRRRDEPGRDVMGCIYDINNIFFLFGDFFINNSYMILS